MAGEDKVKVVVVGVQGPPGPGGGDGGADTPDATSTIKGKLKLTNDLGGTADLPTVPGLRYTNPNPTPAAIGGIPAGTTFNNTPFSTIIGLLLYPSALIYWGTSTNPTIAEADILTFSSGTGASGAGSYDFAAGGYKYIVFPGSFPAAANFVDPSTGFNVGMVEVTDDAAYSGLANTWYFALVTVLGVSYRVYRTKNQLGGTFNIAVT